MMYIRQEQIIGWVMTVPVFVFVGMFSLYPVVDSFVLSLHHIYMGFPAFGMPFIGLENYWMLFQDPVARQALLTTFAFVVLSTGLELIAGLGIALVIHETFTGRGWVRAAILIPWAVPTVVASQMWRFIFNDQYGLVNLMVFGDHMDNYIPWLASPTWAFLAIVIADVWKTASFAGLLILVGLQRIPDELYEAAHLDGATAWQRFWCITFPLLKPVLLIALLFRTMDAFRVFDVVFVMTQGGPGDATHVLQFYGYKTLFAEGQIGYGTAISITVFVIILLLSLFYIRAIGTNLLQRKS